MDRNFESGKHAEILRICANPDCGIEYIVQQGGQKSGTSPVIHVPQVGEQPNGYCSIRCLFTVNGWNYDGSTDAEGKQIPGFRQKYQSFFGIDPDEIRPKGYLAPARRPK